jgi:pimeloyl-ACP methyl ester carboxylesterase
MAGSASSADSPTTSEAGIARLTRLALAAAFLLLGSNCLKLDRFLFSPWIVNEYFLPGSIDSAAWHVRGIIPDTLYREEVELTSSGGNHIYGFLVQPKNSQPLDGVTILYCHGNSHCINRYWGRVELLWEMGYRVFIFDYQGYGRSQGGPTGEACLADGRAALAFLRGRPEVDTTRIVYYGWSMGTFVATYLAADSLKPFGLILESPPASAEALVNEVTVFDIPGSMLTRFYSDFDNENRIARVGVPALLLAGREDEMVPPARHAQRIIAAAEGHIDVDVCWADTAGHENVPYVLGDEYARRITTYIGYRVRRR